jgi:hypothetical protein
MKGDKKKLLQTVDTFRKNTQPVGEMSYVQGFVAGRGLEQNRLIKLLEFATMAHLP